MNNKEMVLVSKTKLLDAIQKVVENALETHNTDKQPKYVCPKTAMATLNVKTSKLQQLRNCDEIKYSKTSSRGLMYDYQSLIDYLDRKVVE
ncbi:hypothetical protein [Kordia sp.]|uniref:hypothetical protein n=1 Tax=Kordia sp. TaxID=1965332 RepID=UPI003D6AF3BA